MQQPEIHKHAIETAVVKWKVVRITLHEWNVRKHSHRNGNHLVGEINSNGNRARLFRRG